MLNSTPLRKGPRLETLINTPQNGRVLSPLRRSTTNIVPQATPDAQVTDEDERRNRRKSAALLKRVSNVAGPAPTAVTGFKSYIAEGQIKEHVQLCTKLFVENKISFKNAWELDIINAVQQIATTDKPGGVFQIFGTSLDVSARVYSCRIDDTYTKILQLAGTVSKKHGGGNVEEDDGGEDTAEAGEDGARKKAKRIKKKKKMTGTKKSTIDYDGKNFLNDLPQIESAFFSTKENSEMSATDNLLTMKIRQNPATHEFDLINKEKYWTTAPDAVLNEGIKDIEFPELQSILLNITNICKKPSLCMPFQDFVFGEWDPDDEERLLASEKTIQDEVVLDADGLPIVELDGSVHDIFAEEPDIPADEFVDDVVEDNEQIERYGNLERIVNTLPDETREETEYGFNVLLRTSSGKVIDKIWAGPSHWKLKILRPSLARFSGKVEQHVVKNTRKNLKGGTDPIHFEDYVEFPSVDVEQKVVNKKRKPASAEKIRLPVHDMFLINYKKHSDHLFTKQAPCQQKSATSNVDCEVPAYNYENANDSHYCSQESGDNHDNGPFDHSHEEVFASEPHENFNVDNLVELPDMVPSSTIPYALHAKKMDTKKLKTAIWKCLTTSDNQESGDKNEEVIPTTFQDLYKRIPQHLNNEMRKELSCALVFSALLHLCNEKNLILNQNRSENCEENDDFTIQKAF